MRGRRGACIAVVTVTVALAGCGDDTRYGDQKIIEALHLEDAPDADAYAIDGDPFCEVEKELLNDRDEVEDAIDADEGVVVASREGNVGVLATGPFGRDCERKARKRLNELDPKPKED